LTVNDIIKLIYWNTNNILKLKSAILMKYNLKYYEYEFFFDPMIYLIMTKIYSIVKKSFGKCKINTILI